MKTRVNQTAEEIQREFQSEVIDQETKELMELAEFLEEENQKDAPSLAVLESWKIKHKSIYISQISVDSDQYYIFTTIKRNTYKQLQASGALDDDEKSNEVLVDKCLLYPQPSTSWRLTCDAGIITTLGKQIAYKSGFVSPQEALSLIKVI